jgi:hypothetical protein
LIFSRPLQYHHFAIVLNTPQRYRPTITKNIYAGNIILPFTAQRLFGIQILITKHLRDVFIENGNGFSVLARNPDPEKVKSFQTKVDM